MPAPAGAGLCQLLRFYGYVTGFAPLPKRRLLASFVTVQPPSVTPRLYKLFAAGIFAPFHVTGERIGFRFCRHLSQLHKRQAFQPAPPATNHFCHSSGQASTAQAAHGTPQASGQV